MKPVIRKSPIKPRGLTLLEITIVLLVLMTLLGTSLVVNRKYTQWKLGREAAETLRTVYSAQRMFLSDNPTVAVNTITATQLLPYLPKKNAATPTELPTVKSLTGTQVTIQVNVYPPVFSGNYDPSGSRTDNLWDVGE